MTFRAPVRDIAFALERGRGVACTLPDESGRASILRGRMHNVIEINTRVESS